MEGRIVVDVGSLRPGSLGPPTGTVWLALGRVSFPLEDWNDFVTVILGAWVSALVRLLRGSSDRESVHFMEGPYEVSIVSKHGGLLTLTLRDHRGERGRSDVQATRFARNVLESAEAVLEACRANGIWSEDEDRLQDDVGLLRSEIQSAVD